MISRVKPANWAVNEKLTSAQMNAVDTNSTYALDKRAAESDTLSSDIAVDATGTITFMSSSELAMRAGSVGSFASINTYSGASQINSTGIVNLGGTNVINGVNTISGTTQLLGTITITGTAINWDTGLSDVTFGSVATASNGVTAHKTTIKGQDATGLLTFGGDVILEAGKGTLIDGSVKMKSDGVTLVTFAPTATTINNATTISSGSLTLTTGSVVVSNGSVAVTGGAITADGGALVSFSKTVAYAASVNVDLSLANHWEFGTLTGNISIAVSNMIAGGYYTFYFKQDGTGGRTVAFTGVTDVEATGVAPNTAAGKTNIYTCVGHTSGINDFLMVTSIATF